MKKGLLFFEAGLSINLVSINPVQQSITPLLIQVNSCLILCRFKGNLGKRMFCFEKENLERMILCRPTSSINAYVICGRLRWIKDVECFWNVWVHEFYSVRAIRTLNTSSQISNCKQGVTKIQTSDPLKGN